MTVHGRFGGFPDEISEYDSSDIVILPVPYDETSTWIKGADKGPAAIIEASENLEFYDIETDSEVYLRGIFTDTPVEEKSSPEQMTDAVFNRVAGHLKKDKFVVTIGGEHTVSIGAVRACAEKAGPLTVLQLDAHADLRDEYQGSTHNHACVMARIKEICPSVQAGIRSMDSTEKLSMDYDRVFFAEKIRHEKGWMEKALALTGDSLYVTIDLDVFDPSVIPATGTPEPGGLGWYEILDLLRLAAKTRKIVGFDIVELCPDKYSHPSDFAAAKLLYKFLSYIYS